MIVCESIAGKTIFPGEAINEQLQKIFSDPIFTVSDILKRFLSFIVQETLEGRSNQLKEYTIGVGVLNKPVNFRPQQDAIVRIHAGRLRRALNHYYKETGKEDPIHITIPKGSYVPVFIEPGTDAEAEIILSKLNEERAVTEVVRHSLVAAVMPFTYFEKEESRISFANGLATQLSTELTRIKNLSVIAYYTMRRLAEKKFDLREVAASVGARYLFTGDIQYQENRFRINIQMINASTSEQIWSRIYERKLTSINMFDVQDDIVRQVISMFVNYCGFQNQLATEAPIMAIA